MKRILLLLVLCGLGYVAFDGYKAGKHIRPTMPEGAWSISYKNGFRAILQDIGDKDSDRRYLSYPFKVPFHLNEAWSFCRPLSEAEINASFSNREWLPGERFEAMCAITSEEKEIPRGFITSVPRLE